MTRDEVLALLRREPDVEAPDLVAVDATDRLLLDSVPDSVPDLAAQRRHAGGDQARPCGACTRRRGGMAYPSCW